MYWLQAEEGEPVRKSLQLDIVGFLAILGEGSVLANAQVSTLSKWIFLPRLIPAPQALMRPTRPTRLEPADGKITGIFSGNHKDSINHIGNIVCDASGLPIHSVRVVSIERDDKLPLKAKTIAPLTAVLFIGFFLSGILLGLSIWQDDGMSIVATILLSLLTSLIGLGNKWTLKLPKRDARMGGDKVPRGDVIIRYPKGSFLVVRCPEEIARELYFAPEAIEYLLKYGPAYRLLSLVGTMMLMGGVICLANAQIELQIAWAGSYMLLGSSYWIVAALPSKLHWDYSCYKVTNECLSDSDMKTKGYPATKETFTQALWRAIAVSQSAKWVRINEACPKTEAWDAWLVEANKQAKLVHEASKGEMKMDPKTKEPVKTWEIPEWNAQAYLKELMAGKLEDAETSKEPLQEV